MSSSRSSSTLLAPAAAADPSPPVNHRSSPLPGLSRPSLVLPSRFWDPTESCPPGYDRSLPKSTSAWDVPVFDPTLPPLKGLSGSNLLGVLAADPFWRNHCEQAAARQPPPFSEVLKLSEPDLYLGVFVRFRSGVQIESDPVLIRRCLPDCWSRWFPDPGSKALPPKDGGTEAFWVMVQKDPWTCFTIAGVAQIKIGDIFAPAVWNLMQLGPWSLTALAVEPKIVSCDIFAPGLRYIDKLAYWGRCGPVSDLFIFGHGFGGACLGWFWFQDGFDLVTEERGLCEDAEAGVKRCRGANGDCDSGFPFIMGVPML